MLLRKMSQLLPMEGDSITKFGNRFKFKEKFITQNFKKQVKSYFEYFDQVPERKRLRNENFI
jgi:hypothetical protein